MINQRKKGQRGEREVIKKIKHLYPEAKRHFEFRFSESEDGVDIENTGMFDFQIKLGQQVPRAIYKYIDQIKDHDGQYKVAVCRRDGERWLAVMELDDFVEILGMLKKEGVRI